MVSKDNSEGTEKITVRFVISEKEQLEKYAKENNQTLSEVIRRATQLFLAAQRKKAELDRRKGGHKVK